MDFKEKLFHQGEPYHFQRSRAGKHTAYPRPSQPNTSQPNQIVNISGWGMGTMEYWNSIMKDYQDKRSRAAGMTNLALGR